MKRYSIRKAANGLNNTYKFEDIFIDIRENPDGEWVKYEDVKKAILVYEDWINGNLTDVACNCQDHMKIKMGKSCVGIGWFCPAHGYKERLSVEIQDNITKGANKT